jgi:hypothetical protein
MAFVIPAMKQYADSLLFGVQGDNFSEFEMPVNNPVKTNFQEHRVTYSLRLKRESLLCSSLGQAAKIIFADYYQNYYNSFTEHKSHN